MAENRRGEIRELFLPYEESPWFLDVDLTIDSIERPERYPLKTRRAEAEG